MCRVPLFLVSHYRFKSKKYTNLTVHSNHSKLYQTLDSSHQCKHEVKWNTVSHFSYNSHGQQKDFVGLLAHMDSTCLLFTHSCITPSHSRVWLFASFMYFDSACVWVITPLRSHWRPPRSVSWTRHYLSDRTPPYASELTQRPSHGLQC